jgi:hypothetical protein
MPKIPVFDFKPMVRMEVVNGINKMSHVLIFDPDIALSLHNKNRLMPVPVAMKDAMTFLC